MTNTTHITEEVYNQLSDTDKAEYRKQWQSINDYIPGAKWTNQPPEHIKSIKGNPIYRTRLVYIPIHPTPAQDIPDKILNGVDIPDFNDPFEFVLDGSGDPTRDMEPEEKNNGWIDIKEALPVKEGRVLVCTHYEKISCAYFMSISNEWDIDGFDGASNLNFVTHWQPLPSPPNI